MGNKHKLFHRLAHIGLVAQSLGGISNMGFTHKISTSNLKEKKGKIENEFNETLMATAYKEVNEIKLKMKP